MALNRGIAFFGSTGGCAASCLAHCLRAKYSCTALVRNPDKLLSLLTAHDISEEIIAAHLIIIQGNVKSHNDVSRALFPAMHNSKHQPQSQDNVGELPDTHDEKANRSVDMIISGIGATPTWKSGALMPSIEDPTICQDGTATILEVLREQNGGAKPLMVVISTTGISDFGRDIPLAMVPLYHWFLSIPHRDKKAMEEMIRAATREHESRHAALREFVVLRPSLLTNGAERGVGSIRADVEDGKVTIDAIGYLISRKDVGGWIFREVVQKCEWPSVSKWTGKTVAITY